MTTSRREESKRFGSRAWARELMAERGQTASSSGRFKRAIERREADRRAADEKKHAEEVSLYRKTHQTLTSQLQAIINPSKK